ncbi:MAG: hypothetical protein U5L04_04540 [Trueperaceae bacterium]|nr:hypothetical protein [Trueperaceae bacterium]
MSRIFVRYLLVLIGLVFFMGAVAQEGSEEVAPTVTLEGFLVETVVLEDGSTEERFVAAEEAEPGDVIEYRLQFASGDSAIPADQLQLTGPVPDSTAYIAGSADSGDVLALLEFSLVEEEVFSETPTITVQNEAGEDVVVPAPPELYDTLRWTVLDPIAPETAFTLRYRVTVR